MLRRATRADLPAIDASLSARAEFAMFPLVNLRDHGANGGHPLAMTFWVGEDADDILGLTASGSVLPALRPEAARHVPAALAGREVRALIGPAPQVAALRAALGLTDAPAQLDGEEPHYLLDLAALSVPDGPGDLVPLAHAPRNTVLDWLTAYEVEALNTPGAEAPDEARADLDRYVVRGSHVVLMDGDRPLAMTGFNARLPEIVQVGGVYTPPALRGRGHARRAVALHLAQARAEGATRATLFSGSAAASRAYEALGFRRIGAWTLLLLRDPVTIHG